MSKDITFSNIKAYLVGYPGSQHIVNASEYLIKKYLPFDTTFLCYVGHTRDWSKFMADYFRQLDSVYVIFALDDYLISSPLDTEAFQHAVNLMGDPTVCIKLCECSEEDQEGYPITTQWCLWDREYLISILDQTSDPWNFEVGGSALHKKNGKESLNIHCMNYNAHSCLSTRWQGIKTEGLSEVDINELKSNGFI